MMLQTVLLPMPILRDSNGNESIHINMNKTENGEIWIFLFTNANELTSYMAEQENEVRHIPNVINRMMQDVLENNYAGIVINPTGKQFIIPARMCKIVFESKND